MFPDDPIPLTPEEIEANKNSSQGNLIKDLKRILFADENFYANHRNNGSKFKIQDFIAYLFLIIPGLFLSYGVLFIFNKYLNIEFTPEHIAGYFIASLLLVAALIFLIPSVKVIINYIFYYLKLKSRFTNETRS